MNRFGTLAIAGALAFSVSAGSHMSFREGLDIPGRADREAISLNVKPTVQLNKLNKIALKTEVAKTTPENAEKSEQGSAVRSLCKTAKANSISLRKIKPAEDEEEETSIAGQYTIQIGDYYFENSVGPISASATITEEDDKIRINCEYFYFDVIAGYDAATGEITFSEMYAGTYNYENTTYYIKFEPFYWDATAKKVVSQTWTATFDASRGVITTPEDHGFSWIAYTDAELTTEYSYFDIFDVEGLAKNNGSGSDNDGIAGEYTIYIGDYYFENSAQSTVTGTATIEEEDGYIIISCDEYFPSDIIAGYNPATGEITFAQMYIGTINYQGTTLYVNFEPFVYDYDEGLIKQSWNATFNASTGMITTEADHGVSWNAYADEDLTQQGGYLQVLDLEGMMKKSGSGTNGSWTPVGEATFMDGWLLPALGIDQTDPENWYNVPVEQNDDNPNIYRLVDPYRYGPIAEYNESTTTGYIQFDVTDPDHVVFALVDAGFASAMANITSFYCYNTLTYYCNYMGMSADQIISMAGDEIPYTTFQNNVVTLGSTVFEKGYDNDACFGDQANPTGGYSWTDEQKQYANMATSIDLSEITSDNNGVTEIVNSSDLAPVRFFNLQGIEVARPASGQVVIRVQGAKATKQIAR